MKAKIIRIGNSRGVRIPKGLLEEAGLEDEVVLEATGDSIVIRPLRTPREGWAESFREMAERGDDKMLDGFQNQLSSWDEEEWQW